MLTLREQTLFTRNLRSLLKAGLPLDDALKRLIAMMPSKKVEIEKIIDGVKLGSPLSKEAEGLLPQDLLSVVYAGEQSSGLESVLGEIHETLIQKQRTQKSINSLLKPLAMFGFGIVIFLCFALFVMPPIVGATQKMSSGRKSEPSLLSQFMVGISDAATAYWPYILVASSVMILTLLVMLKNPEVRTVLYAKVLRTPYLGTALLFVHFSLWARYLSMMLRAGFDDLPRALTISQESMPLALHEGIELFKQDVAIGIGLGPASDPEVLAVDDPRRQWPVLIQIAFMVGSNTGETDDQLRLVSGLMQEDAEAIIEHIFSVTKVIVLVFTGLSAMLPIVSYLFEMLSMMTSALSGLKF